MFPLIPYILSGLLLLVQFTGLAQTPDALTIIRKADEKVRGKTSYGEMSMTIVRPSWSREISFKSWTKGTEQSLILITGPNRDKGTVFLKKNKEMWNWRPTIDRTIKLPPSMMMQSWMGSDFTNDDLVKESSAVEDYTHRVLGSEKIDGYDCWKLELIPKPNAPVVWGKIISWVEKKDYLQLKTAFYDEDNYLVSTMTASDIRTIGGKKLPAVLTMVPESDPGHKTIVRYKDLVFDKAIEDRFFSEQNMRRIQ
jgi:outer membrane lipoprotein-sorting protein